MIIAKIIIITAIQVHVHYHVYIIIIVVIVAVAESCIKLLLLWLWLRMKLVELVLSLDLWRLEMIIKIIGLLFLVPYTARMRFIVLVRNSTVFLVVLLEEGGIYETRRCAMDCWGIKFYFLLLLGIDGVLVRAGCEQAHLLLLLGRRVWLDEFTDFLLEFCFFSVVRHRVLFDLFHFKSIDLDILAIRIAISLLKFTLKQVQALFILKNG